MSRTTAIRLAIFCSILAFAALVVGAVLLADAQSEQRADQRERFGARAAVAASLVDSLFRVAFVSQMQQVAEQYASGATSTADMDRAVRRSGQAFRVIATPEGRVVAKSSSTPDEVVERLRTRPPLLQAALQPNAPYALSSMRFADGEEVIENASVIQTEDGPRVVIAASPAKAYRDFLDGTLAPLPSIEASRAFVADGEGFLLGSSETRDSGGKPAPTLVRAALDRKEGSVGSGDGAEYFASAPLAGSDWRIAVTTPERTLYAPVSGSGRWLPWVMLGVGALALGFIAILLMRLSKQSEQLRTANDELHRSNADLEQFAYAASHDLSAPLRTVAGFAQLLERRYGERLDEEALLYLEHMTQSTDRMQQLIDDLLLYSRAGRAPISSAPVALAEIVDEVVASLQHEIDERGAVVTHDKLPIVRGERGQLVQVVQNLISNGLKFTDGGVPPEVRVGAVREADAWRIEVTDNGIGVDPDKDEIFKMFGRLHPDDAYPGTGIGLALVKRIVERHGGRVSVRPAKGGGSTFAFTVPDRTPAVAPQPAPPVPAGV
jgi:signal transduction histidine kinase